MRVWLDDLRPAPPGWIWTRSTSSTRGLLSSGAVRQLSLDHDLGWSENGFSLLRWMSREGHWPESLHVHSANPWGSRRMLRLILEQAAYPSHTERSFSRLERIPSPPQVRWWELLASVGLLAERRAVSTLSGTPFHLSGRAAKGLCRWMIPARAIKGLRTRRLVLPD